jgi:hypothetical protein
MKKNILLWCSPGFGMIDMWIPIIRKLKENNDITIDFVFPEPSSLRLESKESGLFKLSELFLDRVLYRGQSGRWFIASTLVEAKNGINLSKMDEVILTTAGRLYKGKLSRYFVAKTIGKYLKMLSILIARMKENFAHQSLYDVSLFGDADGVLFDVIAENKSSNIELKNKLQSVPKFSIFHGLVATWVRILPIFSCERRSEKKPNVTVYNMSNLEVEGYKKCYGILEDNIIHAGIPRHDSDWIEFVNSKLDFAKSDIFDSFVFLIGKPASRVNNPIERKKKALKDIYDIVCTKHKLKLVIKLHPKESLDGIDGDAYRDVLGLKNYGKDWIFSDTHPFLLGKKSIFCISFKGGVPLDMLAINKPTIEYLNLVGLDFYDNKDSLRDSFGKPMSQFRCENLVLGANTRVDLERHVESILDKYEDVITSLRSSYVDLFRTFNGASKMVANDILSKINT